MEIGPNPCSLSLSSIVANLILLQFLKQPKVSRFETSSETTDENGENSSRRTGSGDHAGCSSDASWAHSLSPLSVGAKCTDTLSLRTRLILLEEALRPLSKIFDG